MNKATSLIILVLLVSQGINGCFYDLFNGISSDNTLQFSGSSHLSERFISQNTKYVILRNNGIKSIANGAFSGLPRMKVLDLSNNNLLPKDFFAFGHHKNVEAIIFDDNFHENASSTDLEIKISHNYPKLKFLSLRNVGLITISSDFSTYFVGLSHLDLSRNNLNHKDVFTHLPDTVQSLCIENSGFSSISTTSSYSLTNIRNISLNHNNIGDVVLTGAHGKCDSSANPIVCLRLPHVTTFLAANCSLSIFVVKEKLPMKKLDLSSNQIYYLSNDSLVYLNVLKHLNIGNNPLSGMLGMSLLPRLEVLIMDNVNSTMAEVFIYSIFNTRIKYLSISGNLLKELPNHMMKNFKNAVELNLSNNLLKSLDLDQNVSNLYSLVHVNVSDNIIEDLGFVKLRRHYHVQLLDIRRNPLTSLNISSFSGVQRNTNVLLSSTCS
ncbi:protein artichoke-like [Copidosoma floridanum]|uniref:protein artichoke-like n=1 Tax=Copidosoma floridanum TaxID=29053 RepID=UPI000C6FA91D|nr:protein artichoke-like [Copidosoma floridanum]